jgi:hypothetical protein
MGIWIRNMVYWDSYPRKPHNSCKHFENRLKNKKVTLKKPIFRPPFFPDIFEHSYCIFRLVSGMVSLRGYLETVNSGNLLVTKKRHQIKNKDLWLPDCTNPS